MKELISIVGRLRAALMECQRWGRSLLTFYTNLFMCITTRPGVTLLLLAMIVLFDEGRYDVWIDIRR